ncbi:hypothetical protein Bca4012_068414 [Brassica carinata]
MESSATVSPGSLLPHEPPDPDLPLYPRRALSLRDLNPQPPPEPPDPPDRATPSQSKTFTIIIKRFFPRLELAVVDSNYLLVLSVSHSSRAPSCDYINLFVSTILKPRTLEVFVVSFDVLCLTGVGSSVISLPCSILSILHVWPPSPSRSFKRGSKQSLEDPCHQSPQTYFLSQLVVNLASDVGGNPLRRPSLSYLFVNLASDVGGNPLRRPTLSYLFGNRVSDVGGNPLWRPVLSYQKLVRSCSRCTTLTSSLIVESTSLPCLCSMNGENFSDFFPSFSFSLLTGLLPCGAVCTGPEGAIEITPVFLVGEDCLSTSLVTIPRLSDFVVEVLSTHSNLVLNSLMFNFPMAM